MARGRLRVLVVSHDATRTGAPIQLLHTWRSLLQASEVDIHFLLVRGGDIESQFAELAPTTILSDVLPGSRTALALGSARVIRVTERRLLALFLRTHQRFDVAVLNTVTLGRFARVLARTGVPLVTHVHELDQWMALRVPPNDVRAALDLSARLIAVSEAVRDALIRRGADSDRIAMVYEGIPLGDSRLGTRKTSGLSVADGGPLVGGVGTLDTRKGPDLFVQVALAVAAEMPTVKFLWLGEGTVEQRAWLEHDSAGAGLDGHVFFGGAVSDPESYYPSLDVFALTSREDPCPLAMLEAAANKVPVVAFDGSGGASEFASDGCGILVPYLRTDLMARAVMGLLTDPLRARQIGAAGRQRVEERHDIRRTSKAVLDVVHQAVGSS